MKKIGYANVSEISIDNELDIGVYTIGGVGYVILGGEFTASGVKNYLRPLDKVKKNWNDLENYSRTRRDVVFCMDNKNVSMLLDAVRDLQHDTDRQKW